MSFNTHATPLEKRTRGSQQMKEQGRAIIEEDMEKAFSVEQEIQKKTEP